MKLLRFTEKLDLENLLEDRRKNEKYTIYNGRPASI